MAYAERRGPHWRARFRRADGTYGSETRDDDGERFKTKTAARRWGDAEEARVEAGLRPATLDTGLSTPFGEWVNTWYARQNLAESTMGAYRTNLEARIMPYFEQKALGEITAAHVIHWEGGLRADGLSEETVRTYRGVLSVVLADAAAEGLITANPVQRPKGRGMRAGKSARRGPEKPITDPLGALLLAERCGVMSGRGDEFVLVLAIAYLGLRWGEAMGLERRYVRGETLRVEQQVYELDNGSFLLCPPKEDSYRDVDVPPFLAELLSRHMQSVRQSPVKSAPGGGTECACIRRDGAGVIGDIDPHPGGRFVFIGRPRGRTVGDQILHAPTAHWRRSGFERMVFKPAAEGWYPSAHPRPRRPVPLLSGTYPGVPVRGRAYVERSDSCWLPIAMGLTPHGLRHAHRTWLVEDGTPEVLAHERIGHELGGIGARYTHVTSLMRERLIEDLTTRWKTALEQRAAIDPHSAVMALDELLRPYRERAAQREPTEKISQSAPSTRISPLRSRHAHSA